MKQYTFTEEPSGDNYRALVAYAARMCSEAQLVIRDSVELSPTAAAVVASLEPWLLERKRVSAWFGTELHGGTAQLLRYGLCPDTVAVLSQSVGRLFEWVQPERPEDLALIFPDGKAWLTSIAHERDGYLTMTREQADAFFHECAEVSRLLDAGAEEQ